MNASSDRPTVFIVDDEAAVRDSLQLLLRTVGQEAETFRSGPEFLAAYCEDRPGCLLLDRTMPIMSGLEVQYRLNERQSILPVIFMAACSDSQVVVTAMQAGAVNFLEKPFSEQILFDAIRDALDKDCANRQALSEPHDIARRLQTLTPREREVLDRVVLGHSNKVVADELGVSRRTVDIHWMRMMEKMCASSLVHLMRMVRRAKDT